MRVRFQMVIETDEGERRTVVEDVACWVRTGLRPEELGVTLAEAKELLRSVQQTMVTEQVAEYLAQQRHCGQCGAAQSRKGQHTIVFRSLFGTLQLPSPRLYRCTCQSHLQRSFSPLADLLPERTAPELLYLEAKWASLMSYGLTIDLLAEVLPLEGEVNTRSVRRHVECTAERAEAELGEEQSMFIEGCPRDWGNLPIPPAPLTVGLDGGYVHARDAPSRREGWFEVIAGKSMTEEEGSKCFAFVHRYDTKPKRRLFEVLQSQGMQMNQQITFLSDGGDTVRDLQLYLNPQAEHLLDWFHVTMRLTVMGQMAKGLRSEEFPSIAQDTAAQLERLKWFLWHGNVFRALQTIEDLEMDLEAIEESNEPKKLLKNLREFGHYVAINKAFIPNYGDRYRNGETISTAFVESTVNQVVSKRFVKKQQMRWTERGAHLLLQVRTRTLNQELRETFCRWYPGMKEAA